MLNQKALIYAADLTAKTVIYAVQNDTGRVLEIAFGDYAIPSGATAQLWIRSSKGTLTFAAGTIANDVVTVPLSASNLAEAGIAAAQLQITAGGSYIKSLPFIINIQEEANGQTITPSEETLIEQVIAEMQAQLSQQIADWQTALDNKVPQTRKVNNKALAEDITLTSTDVGAPSASDYNSFVSATESALVGKVPQTRTVNGQALSSDITLDAGDITFTPTTDLESTNVQNAIEEALGLLKVKRELIFGPASSTPAGSTYTLQKDISEFDFLEVGLYLNGYTELRRIPVSAGTEFALRTFDLTNTGGTTLALVELTVSFSGSVMTVNYSRYWSWSGSASAGATITDNGGGHINSVYGVKYALA